MSANFTADLSDLLERYGAEVKAAARDAAREGAKVMESALRDATPIRTGKLAKGWVTEESDYKPGKFGIYDKVKVSGGRMLDPISQKKSRKTTTWKGVPLVNVLEYGSHGKPFAADTTAANEERVLNEIISNIEAAVKG